MKWNAGEFVLRGYRTLLRIHVSSTSSMMTTPFFHQMSTALRTIIVVGQEILDASTHFLAE